MSGSLGSCGRRLSVTTRRTSLACCSGGANSGMVFPWLLLILRPSRPGSTPPAGATTACGSRRAPGQVGARERAGELDGDLDVLRLVGADRDLVGAHGEDVGGHQHRVREQAHVHAVVGVASGGGVGGDERLVGMRPVERSLAGDVRQQGADLRDGGHARLPVHVHAVVVEAAGQQRGGHLPRAVAQLVRLGPAVERVQVGDEHVRLASGLGGEPGERPDGAGVVAEVQLAGRLDAGQGDGHDGVLSRAHASTRAGRHRWAQRSASPRQARSAWRPGGGDAADGQSAHQNARRR